MRTLTPLIYSLTAIITTSLFGDYLDDIGHTDLITRLPELDASGITLTQVESGTNWKVNPTTTGLSTDLFTYYSDSAPYDASATEGTGGESFLDTDTASGHANTVADRYFDTTTGVATNPAAIQAFTANYFYNTIIVSDTDVGARVVNQSFVFNDYLATVDQAYDNYAATFNTLFLNGLNTNYDPAEIHSPASTYNGIAVGVADDTVNPLSDGRSKPDIVAPGSSYSSYTTPLVAGAAALLIQSAELEHAGTGTADAATDIRTLKALLLNGATKNSLTWANTTTQPLDSSNGAGTLNINQSQYLLASGQYNETENDHTTTSGAEHLPPENTNNLSSNTGWALSNLTTTVTGFGRNRAFADVTDHYYFQLDANTAQAYYLTTTLAWNRQNNRSTINNLDLFLYQLTTDTNGDQVSTLITSSQSTIDNVEHIYQKHLTPGRYVIQVHKSALNLVTTSETYALAFEFKAAPAPATITDLTATTLSTTEIQLNWSDSSGDETNYLIQRRTGTNNYTTIATIEADSTHYTDTNLSPGTHYDYQIIAANTQAQSTAASTSATTDYSAMQKWCYTYFGTYETTTESADNANPDGDTQSNLIEFATGLDPTTNDGPALNTEQLKTNQTFSFCWLTTADLTLSIGYTTDLNTNFTYQTTTQINDASNTTFKVTNITDEGDGYQTWTIEIIDPAASDAAFIQLAVEQPSN